MNLRCFTAKIRISYPAAGLSGVMVDFVQDTGVSAEAKQAWLLVGVSVIVQASLASALDLFVSLTSSKILAPRQNKSKLFFCSRLIRIFVPYGYEQATKSEPALAKRAG